MGLMGGMLRSMTATAPLAAASTKSAVILKIVRWRTVASRGETRGSSRHDWCSSFQSREIAPPSIP